jgi:hypothetical protein
MNPNLHGAAIDAVRIPERLAALDVPTPAGLSTAVEVWREATAYKGPDDVAVAELVAQARTVEPGKVAELVDAVAAAVNRRDATVEHRGRVLEALARRLVAAQAEATPTVLADAGPKFDAVADEFTANYRRLPLRWQDANGLAQASPSAFAAFARARELVALLDAFADVRSRLVASPPGPVHAGTAYAKVPNSLAAERVAAGDRSTVLGRWSAVLEVPGAELHWWRSEADRLRHVAELPTVEVRHQRDGIGWRPVEVEVKAGTPVETVGRIR